MLTSLEYASYKKKLESAKRDLATLEAKRTQLVEHLRLTYGLTPDEAKVEVERLKAELPVKEAEFDEKYKEFNKKWEAILKAD